MNPLHRIKSITVNGPLETAGATIFTADRWQGGRNLGGKFVAVFAEDAATFPADDQIADAQALAHAANVLPGLVDALKSICWQYPEASEAHGIARQALSLATNVPVNS
jgi:hypothetical protein